RRDWNDRIPTRIDKEIVYALPEELMKTLDNGSKQSLFKARHEINRILLHPSLQKEKLSDQNWKFLDVLRRKVRNAPAEETRAWIEGSPYLNAILSSALFREV